ncbi:hypothetical protein QKQ66_gp021 [Dione juno nucleopolyhedrovirus]|uniref:Uncharacterized protein n=1 Tax=Dione juno nucleopolyhedrovirus TaxID=2594175 RepID=A0AAE6LC62_9ABAC|nr:hypothetical protein QKQ66_gp021 [Dione juno nucleopolyhedrovirus]QDL56938.1 hypothetical protein DijuNPV-ORF-21 [Dione juno nucleopolyhedrovirus]
MYVTGRRCAVYSIRGTTSHILCGVRDRTHANAQFFLEIFYVAYVTGRRCLSDSSERPQFM